MNVEKSLILVLFVESMALLLFAHTKWNLRKQQIALKVKLKKKANLRLDSLSNT